VIPLLQFSTQRIPSAFDLIKVIVRQFAPLLKHLAMKVLPVTFHALPVHSMASHLSRCVGGDTAFACRCSGSFMPMSMHTTSSARRDRMGLPPSKDKKKPDCLGSYRRAGQSKILAQTLAECPCVPSLGGRTDAQWMQVH
jgi:hypothetical protein